MPDHAPGFLAIVNDARSRVTECTVADVEAWLSSDEAFRLVDVREESEWNRGHLPGAEHLGNRSVVTPAERVVRVAPGRAHGSWRTIVFPT